MDKKEIQEKPKIDEEPLAMVTGGTQDGNAAESVEVEDEEIHL